jgi:hypothetical protein
MCGPSRGYHSSARNRGKLESKTQRVRRDDYDIYEEGGVKAAGGEYNSELDATSTTSMRRVA